MQVEACAPELAVAQVAVAFAAPVVVQVEACAFVQAAVQVDIQIVAQKLFALAVHALRAEQVYEL